MQFQATACVYFFSSLNCAERTFGGNFSLENSSDVGSTAVLFDKDCIEARWTVS